MGKWILITHAKKDIHHWEFEYLKEELKFWRIPSEYYQLEGEKKQYFKSFFKTAVTLGKYKGWGYFISPNTLINKDLLEFLEMAIEVAVESKDINSFPIIALMSDLNWEDLPASIKVKYGLSLDDPDVFEKIKTMLKNSP